MAPLADSESIVVLGAGLAGLSFVDALLDRRPGARLVIVDRRAEWGRDRTWCTWLTGELRFSELARHRWSRWRVMRGGHEVLREARHSPYIHLDSRDLYRHVLARIDRAPHARLRSAHRVTGARHDGGRWVVDTDHGPLHADRLVDALGWSSPLGPRERSAGALTQRFLGWEVETEAPVLDPTTATLMDFRGSPGGEITFFYVLPFSPTRALVEHTTIGAGGPPTAARRDALTAELTRLCGGQGWRICHEERGLIPMSDGPEVLHRGPASHVIGSAAGAIRPSSGYAFTRTQRHVRQVVDTLVAGTPPPARLAPARYAVLDRLFLSALHGAPGAGERLLWQVATGVDPDRFARFMTDVSSPVDDAHVAASVPTLPLSLASGALRR